MSLPLRHIRCQFQYESLNTTEALSLEEIEALFQESEKLMSSYPAGSLKAKSAQLKCVVLHVLLILGMRVSELCHLKIKDFFLKDGIPVLFLKLKGGMEHTVAMPDSLRCLIDDYMQNQRQGAPHEEPLFVACRSQNHAKPLSRTAVWKFIKELKTRAEIKKYITSFVSSHCSNLVALTRSSYP